MTLKLTLAVLSLLLLLASSMPKNPSEGKIKTIYISFLRDTLTYHYDMQGRVASISTHGGYLTTYGYNGNTATETTKGGGLITMYLNDKGLVDSLTDVDSTRTSTIDHGSRGGGQINLGFRKDFLYSGRHVLPTSEIAGVTTDHIISFSKKFTYDDMGFIKEERVYLYGGKQVTSTNEVANGNIISYAVKYPVDTISMKDPVTGKMENKVVTSSNFMIKNSFDTDKINTLATDDLFGKSSRNLAVRSVHYGEMSRDSDVTTFYYTFDKEARVSTLITKVKTNDPPEEKVYSERPDTCVITYY